jgi:hypothetical protein
MSVLGDVIAGCAPGTSECADQTAYPGLDNWFVVLVLVLAALLMLAVAAGVVRYVSHRSIRRVEVPSANNDSAARA